ncbi:MAG: glycosyltransferase family 39 protein [Steroidobacteraceae bacterium]
MLKLIDHWFEPVNPSQDYRRHDYILLAVILAVGTWLRFWQLDNVGLHGDEDIMGLAARAVVEQGEPLLPSGMNYSRALAHTYLLAGSTMLFGDNEWALRLPSAIVGSLCGLFAFFMGRRFLDPKPNLAFVATIVFLPAMIDVSMTARMYVFLIAGLLLYGTFLFRWERTRTALSFVAAFLTLVITIHFHPLAVFSAPLFLFPGLVNQSWKQLAAGAVAMLTAGGIFFILGELTRQNYPEESEQLILPPEVTLSPLELLFQGHMRLAVAVALAAALAVMVIGTTRMERWKKALPAVLLLAIGAVACVTLHYHIGAIALLFGAILWLRAGLQSSSRLLMVGALVGFMALMQLYVLQGTGEFPGRTLIGAFVGTPSIWPILRFAELSTIGVALFAATLVFAVYRLVRGHRIPMFYLFFAMAVWAPLFAIGLLKWNVADRYTMGALPFFLLAPIASVMYVMRNTGWGARLRENSIATAGIAVVFVAAIINPAAAWQASKNDYRDHPDHKGAAEFIRNLNPGPDDIIIAEDSIVQTYYLGRIDYRLQSVAGARNHSTLRRGILYGQYTNTPVIGSGTDLGRVLERASDNDVYIISSGQVSEGLVRRNRADGIAQVLSSERLETVFVGRDGKTTIWKQPRQEITSRAYTKSANGSHALLPLLRRPGIQAISATSG